MTPTRVKLFDKELQDRALLFKALGHPARLAILRYLAEIKTCIFGDISDELPLSRSTVTQHLKELKKVGLVSGTVDGVKMNYCINPAKVLLLKDMMELFIEEISFDDENLLTDSDCC